MFYIFSILEKESTNIGKEIYKQILASFIFSKLFVINLNSKNIKNF